MLSIKILEQKALTVRDAAWQIAKTTSHMADWQNFRHQWNYCLRLIRKAKSDFYLSLVANTSDVWKIIKSLKNNSPAYLPPKICFEI